MLAALFLAATLLAGTANTADAAPASKCRNHPESYKVYRGKRMSDKKIERIKDRGGEDHHGSDHQYPTLK